MSATTLRMRTGPGPSLAKRVDRNNWRPEETWLRSELVLAFVGVVIIAMRFRLTSTLLTAGDVMAVVLLPLWLPNLRRYIAGRTMIILGLLAVAAGIVLTALNAHDHAVGRGQAFTNSLLMISLVFSAGFLLWARQRLSPGALSAAFGLGLLLGLSPSSGLFPTNPWKFGFSVPVTFIVLGLMQMTGRRVFELVALVILCIVSIATDARSAFAILFIAAAFTGWQIAPRSQSRRGSAARVVAALGVTAVAVYNLGQALILDGAFGVETQQRTAQQVNEAGSLILGGRPEIAATANLMLHHPLGFGSGSIPNYEDIKVAKNGMAVINYDPNNGYVERYMFGQGYALHSVLGDLWAKFGWAGLLMVAFIFLVLMRCLGRTLAARTASSVLLYSAILTLWNLFFSPYLSSLRILILALGLGLQERLNVPLLYGAARATARRASPTPASVPAITE